MRQYAFIKNGIVLSIIEGKVDGSRNWEDYYGDKKGMLCVAIPDNEAVGVGFKYANNVFENPIPILTEAEQLEQWRKTFTTELYKLKIALENKGDLVTVENIIASQPKQVQIAWNNTPTVRRNSPTVASLAIAMQYTDEVLDQLFKDANEVVL